MADDRPKNAWLCFKLAMECWKPRSPRHVRAGPNRNSEFPTSSVESSLIGRELRELLRALNTKVMHHTTSCNCGLLRMCSGYDLGATRQQGLLLSSVSQQIASVQNERSTGHRLGHITPQSLSPTKKQQLSSEIDADGLRRYVSVMVQSAEGIHVLPGGKMLKGSEAAKIMLLSAGSANSS